MNYRYYLLLLVLFSWGWAGTVRAQNCTASPPSPRENFKFYDVETKQEITGRFLCVGRRIRVVDASTPRHTPAQLLYRWEPTVVCRDFRDTTSFYTPTAAGPLVLTININANQSGGTGSSGLLVAYPAFEVKTAPPPAFTLSSCTPGTVQVTITDQTYDQYTIQLGNGPVLAATRNTPTTYPVPLATATSVVVTGQYAAAALCANTTRQTFTSPPAPRAAQLQRVTLQGTTAQFAFAGLQAGYRYSLQLREGNGYRTVADIPATTTSYSLPNAPQPGCYRLLQNDGCQPSVVALPSNELCTLALTATAQNNANLLTWVTELPATSFIVLRDGQTLAQLPAGTTRYLDAAVSCGTRYTYQVRAVATVGTLESAEVSATAVSGDAPTVPTLLASYNLRNQVEVSIVNPVLNVQYVYQRGTALLTTTAATRVLDSLAAPGTTVCYSAAGRNACGNLSAASAAVCPVILAAEATDADASSVRLAWTTLGAPTPTQPVTYRLLTLAADNTVLNSRVVTLPTALDQPAVEQQVIRYRIEATGGDLPAPSYSNVVTVPRRLRVFIPNAFSPNGDGQNDVFEVKGRFIGSFLLVIVDRNGQEIFRATDRTQTWDGRINGNPPVPAAYVWRFSATDATGQRLTQHGTVTILR